MKIFRGAPTLKAAPGEWSRPLVFRMTLWHSRHGYVEAVDDQKGETFLRLHNHAFRAFGSVPRVVRPENLKAAIVRVRLYDPANDTIYVAFAAHSGFTSLPTQPRHPQENGKQERSAGYVKDKAQGAALRPSRRTPRVSARGDRTVARPCIHGTTRRQVWTYFLQVEQPALQSVAASRSAFSDRRAPGACRWPRSRGRVLFRAARAAGHARLLRVYHKETLAAVHHLVRADTYARPASDAEASTRQQSVSQRLLGQCERVAPRCVSGPMAP